MALADFPHPRDHKITATVSLLRFDRGYAKALDAHGVEYFIFHNAVETMGQHDFGDLQIGSHVRLMPIDHPRGRRGIEVEIVEI